MIKIIKKLIVGFILSTRKLRYYIMRGYKIFNKKKIDFTYLRYGQLSRYRSLEMVKILKEQIKKFKDTNTNQNNKFILLEV